MKNSSVGPNPMPASPANSAFQVAGRRDRKVGADAEDADADDDDGDDDAEEDDEDGEDEGD